MRTMAVGGQAGYPSSFHRTSQREWEQPFSKLSHQVCTESMLPCVSSEENPHHCLSREKEGDISPRYTHQEVLFSASLAAQASLHKAHRYRHIGVSLGITHHKYPAMASLVPPLIIAYPIMRHSKD